MKSFNRHIKVLLNSMLLCMLGMLLPANAAAGMDDFETLSFNKTDYNSSLSVLHLPGDVTCIQAGSFQSATSQLHTRFEKKRKIKFLIRHLQHQPAVRKVSTRDNFELPPAGDPDHEPVPDEIWHTRPRYYIFLFRYYPF